MQPEEAALSPNAERSTPDDPALYLHPDNWPVWCLWRDLETQWRIGHSGATGLDYPSVLAVIAQRFKPRQRKTVFYLVQAMEEVTLHEWREQAARARDK